MALTYLLLLAAAIPSVTPARLQINHFWDSGCSSYATEFYPFTDGGCYNYGWQNTNSARVVSAPSPQGDYWCEFYAQYNCQGRVVSLPMSGRNLFSCVSHAGGIYSVKCNHGLGG